jgi:hypothetical protein
MRPDSFQEDGCPPGACTAFGYRSCPADPWSAYTPTQATGCNFAMHNAPGFSNVRAGVTYTVDLSFIGRLIDTASSGRTIGQQNWNVVGTATARAQPEAMAAVSLAAFDQILMAHHTRNDESGVAELHIVISRPADQPPLDPMSLGLTVQDGGGQALAFSSAPVVHEIGGRGRTTANVVHTLAHGSNTPAQMHLAGSGGPVTMAVHAR